MGVTEKKGSRTIFKFINKKVLIISKYNSYGLNTRYTYRYEVSNIYN